MRLTTKSRYGLRILLDIAAHEGEGMVRAKDITRRLGLTIKYVESLARLLAGTGYVRGCRGANGGYCLGVEPEAVSIGRVIRHLEGGLDMAECVARPEACLNAPVCPTRLVWVRAAQALARELDGLTLNDLLNLGSGVQGACPFPEPPTASRSVCPGGEGLTPSPACSFPL